MYLQLHIIQRDSKEIPVGRAWLHNLARLLPGTSKHRELVYKLLPEQDLTNGQYFQ